MTIFDNFPTETETNLPELEIRLGVINHKGLFNAGVTLDKFTSIYLMLEKAPHWISKSAFQPMTDHFYHIEANSMDLLRNPTLVRSTLSVSDDGKLQTRHICKRSMSQRTYKARQMGTERAYGRAYDVRVSLNIEEIAPDVKLPPTVPRPVYVRIKERHDYVCGVSKLPDVPIWKYSLTRSWQGASHTEAEQCRVYNPDKCMYEVELECINPKKLIEVHGSLGASLSMLLKFLDIATESGESQFIWEHV